MSQKDNIAKTGETYKVHQNEVPDSALAQQMANERHISSQIIDFKITEEICYVHTRAILPNGQFVEDVIVQEFSILEKLVLITELKKAEKYGRGGELVEYDTNGKPTIRAKKQWEMECEFIKERNFIIRDLISKSYRRCYLKLLNRDWREDEEKSLENREREIVEDQIKDRKTKYNIAPYSTNIQGQNISIQKPVSTQKTDQKNLPDPNNKIPGNIPKKPLNTYVTTSTTPVTPTNPIKTINEPKIIAKPEIIIDQNNIEEVEIIDPVKDNHFDLLSFIYEKSNNQSIPPLGMDQLERICRSQGASDPMQYFILKNPWQGKTFRHWDFGDNKQYRMIRVEYEDKNIKPLSIYFHKIIGLIKPSKNCVAEHPDWIEQDFLDEIGFGVNIVLAPESLYDEFKSLRGV